MKTIFSTVSMLSVGFGLLGLVACSEAKTPPTVTQQAQEPPAMNKDALSAYPLTTCPISGEKLGSMGEPVVKIYEGEEVRFCCNGCLPDFEKDLAANVAKVKADKAKVK